MEANIIIRMIMLTVCIVVNPFCSILTGNTGSGIVLRSSIMTASDNLTISYNIAQSGGALKILDISLVSINVEQ